MLGKKLAEAEEEATKKRKLLSIVIAAELMSMRVYDYSFLHMQKYIVHPLQKTSQVPPETTRNERNALGRWISA
jgi:hypothetical protein